VLLEDRGDPLQRAGLAALDLRSVECETQPRREPDVADRAGIVDQLVQAREIGEATTWLTADWATTANAVAAHATLRRDRSPQLALAAGTSALVHHAVTERLERNKKTSYAAIAHVPASTPGPAEAAHEHDYHDRWHRNLL
jgi:hypothetical protein